MHDPDTDNPIFDDCCLCDCYVLDFEEWPFCPTCAKLPLEERKALFVEWAQRLQNAV